MGVPQSLAYATLAGLPPEYGLYASVVPLLVYSIWSTSTSVAIGPTAPTAIMIASAVDGAMNKLNISETNENYLQIYQSVTMTLTFVCGLILILFGLIRAGFIINFLSRPVMTGFIMSAAFIILINQFRALLGLRIGRSPLFIETFFDVLTNLDTIHWQTALISFISLLILFSPKCCLKKKIPRWVPIPLILITSLILISYFCELEDFGVDMVGSDIKKGMPSPTAPNFVYIPNVIGPAIVVAIVSYMGSIALAKGFELKKREIYKNEMNAHNEWTTNDKLDENERDPSTNSIKSTQSSKTEENEENENEEMNEFDSEKRGKRPPKPLSLPRIELNANKEFIAYGISNVIGSFFSAFAVSGSFSRSALNFEMNGHTQIYNYHCSTVKYIINNYIIF